MTQYAFEDSIDIPVNRSRKPREVGLTFCWDCGEAAAWVDSKLEAVGEYLDLVKWYILTARLTPRERVIEKAEIYAKHDVKVFPGGMSLEAALICRKVDQFFEEAKALGCSLIEVSESELHMVPETKLKLVEMGAERGFQVLAELGPHRADEPFAAGHIIREARRFLDAGAWKIVLEGDVLNLMKPWESQTAAEDLFRVVDEIGKHRIIFETYDSVDLMQWLILEFGPDVSLGNVPWDFIIPLEHIRRGLNLSDTWYGKFASL